MKKFCASIALSFAAAVSAYAADKSVLPIIVAQEDFQREVLKSDKPVLVMFSAEWCGACKATEPYLEEMQGSRPHLKIVKADADKNKNFMTQYDFKAFPTLVLFKNGQVMDSLPSGLPKRSVLHRFVDGQSSGVSAPLYNR